MVMGTKYITMSNNKPSSGSSKGSSSHSNSQDSEPKCSSDEVITTTTTSRTKLVSAGIAKKQRSTKKTGYTSMSQQLGKLPEGAQKPVQEFQQHFVQYDGENFEQLEYWQSDGSKNNKDIGMGDIQQCKLEIVQSPQCFGFPHNAREYNPPFKIQLTIEADRSKTWCQTINFYAFSLTCTEYDNFGEWRPNFEATGLDGHHCSDQIQMQYNQKLHPSQEFVKLKFQSSSCMLPRYLVFICKIGKDVLAARYIIPTIILSRKNDQFCKAFDILMQRGGVPKQNLCYLIERGIFTTEMSQLMLKKPQVVEAGVPFESFCDFFLSEYSRQKFERSISNEELQCMYQRLYANSSNHISSWCERTVQLLSCIRSLWEFTFPFPLISTLNYQKSQSEDILQDGEYGDFIIRIAFSQLGALAVTNVGHEVWHNYSIQTDLEFEQKNELCRMYDQTIIFDCVDDPKDNPPALVIQRLKNRDQLLHLIGILDGQKRRLSKHDLIELCRQADINIFKLNQDPPIISNQNLNGNNNQYKREVQEAIRRYGSNNDNIFKDIMDNDMADQPDIEMLDFIQNNTNSNNIINSSQSPLLENCQEGFKTYPVNGHFQQKQANNAQNQFNLTTNLKFLQQHDQQVLHNLHNVHGPHVSRGQPTMHAFQPPPFSSPNFPPSRVNFPPPGFDHFFSSAPDFICPPLSSNEPRRNFNFPPQLNQNQTFNQYQRPMNFVPSQGEFFVPELLQNLSSQSPFPQSFSSQTPMHQNLSSQSMIPFNLSSQSTMPQNVSSQNTAQQAYNLVQSPQNLIPQNNLSSQTLIPPNFTSQNMAPQSMAQQAYNEINNISYSSVNTVPQTCTTKNGIVPILQQQNEQQIVLPMSRVESQPVQCRKSIVSVEDSLIRSCSENIVQKKDDKDMDFLIGDSNSNLAEGYEEKGIIEELELDQSNWEMLFNDFSQPEPTRQLP